VPSNSGVMGAEIILHSPEIGALVRKIIAAGMAQHVRPDTAELRLLASQAHDVVD